MELTKTIVFHIVLALVMAALVWTLVWIDMTYETRHVVPVVGALGIVAFQEWAKRRFWPNAR